MPALSVKRKKELAAPTPPKQEEVEERNVRKLKTKDLSSLFTQLSALLSAGVNVVRALAIAAQEEGLKPKLKQVYLAILTSVRRGESLSAAMDEQGCFPQLALGLIQAGEANGQLMNSCDQLAHHYDKEFKMEKQVKAAMTYPVILLVMTVIVVLIIFTFVLPQFEDMFANMESLPAITSFLMDFSHFLVERWYAVLFGAAVVFLALRAFFSAPLIRYWTDYLKVRMPLLGNLFRTIYTARFARSLSSLYGSGMNIVSSIQIARRTVGNSYIEKQFDLALSELRRGAPLSEALHSVDGFRVKLYSIIQVGEESGSMDTVLVSMADTMEYEAQEASKQILSILEPLMIVIMAVVVGGIMIGVMMPIIQSYGAIEGSANI